METKIELLAEMPSWYNGQDVVDALQKWEPEQFMACLSFTPAHRDGYTTIGKVVGTLSIDRTSESVKPEIVAELQKKTAAIWAAAQNEVTQIQREIQELLAIEDKSESYMGLPPNDDIPF